MQTQHFFEYLYHFFIRTCLILGLKILVLVVVLRVLCTQMLQDPSLKVKGRWLDGDTSNRQGELLVEAGLLSLRGGGVSLFEAWLIRRFHFLGQLQAELMTVEFGLRLFFCFWILFIIMKFTFQTACLVLLLCTNLTLCFEFVPVVVSPSSTVVSTTTTYQFTLQHTLTTSLLPTDYASTPMGTSDNIVITFPSEFSTALLSGFTCQVVIVNSAFLSGYACTQNGLQIVISNAFADGTIVEDVTVSLGGITNIGVALTSQPFLAAIGNNTSASSSAASVTYTAGPLNSVSVTFPGGIVNRTSNLQISLTLRDELPSGGKVTVQFPSSLTWTRELTSIHNLPIDGTLTCYGTTSNIDNGTISCIGQASTQIVTISGGITSTLITGSVLTFIIEGLFAPPTTESIDSLTVTTTDSSGNSINTGSGTISGMVAQTMTNYALARNTGGAMGPNTNLPLSISFTTSDYISDSDYFQIVFPSDTVITFLFLTSSVIIKSGTQSYNATNFTITVPLSTSSNYYSPSTNNIITFLNYKTPTSTEPTGAITTYLMSNGYPKMQASTTLTIDPANYTIGVAAGDTTVNTLTTYTVTVSLLDQLLATGYITVTLDPWLTNTAEQVNYLNNNMTVTLAGSSINANPAHSISSSTTNGTTSYTLTLTNLNTSSSQIPPQSITITLSNLLNFPAVVTLNSFSLSTFYSNANYKVADGQYSSSITLTTGSITLNSVTSTADTTYTFTTITISSTNQNPIPSGGTLAVTIPSQIDLLGVSTGSLVVVGGGVSTAFTLESPVNNSLSVTASTDIPAGSNLTLAVGNIQTQNTTATSSTFYLHSYDASNRTIDVSSASVGLEVTQGNSFNSLTLTRGNATNSLNTNYTIQLEQKQQYFDVKNIILTINSPLLLSSLGRIVERTYISSTNNFVESALIFLASTSTTLRVQLSHKNTANHTLVLQTVINPPTTEPLTQPILVQTTTSDYSNIFSSQYLSTITNDAASALTVSSHSFSNTVYAQNTQLTFTFQAPTDWPNIVYSLVMVVPTGVDPSSATCAAGYSCAISDQNINISVTNSSAFASSTTITLDPLTNPSFNVSTDPFTLTTYSNSNYLIATDTSTIQFLPNCTLPCRTCSVASTNCTSCYSSPDTTLILLDSGSCLDTCPNNTYQLNDTCIDCDASCETCFGEATNCTSCPSSTLLYNNTCLAACPNATYSTGTQCIDCHVGCGECNSTTCLNCAVGFLTHNQDCVSSCPNGTLAINTSCVDCTSPCLHCQNVSTQCTDCIDYYYLDGTICNNTCPSSSDYVTVNNSCEACTAPCASCTLTDTNCTSCQAGATPLLLNFTCLASCPEQYYPNSTHCLECSLLGIGCVNCSSETTCNTCDAGYNFFPDNSTCISENTTVPGYVAINGTLESCQGNCTTCENTTINCTSCSGNYSLYDAQCLETCPENTTVSVSNVCEFCVSPCNQCVNSTSTCLSCTNASGLFLDGTSCVAAASCPNATYAQTATLTCSACNSSCLLCDGTAQNCSSCASGFNLIASNYTCSASCPDGTVALSNVCQNCTLPCVNCQGAVDFCLTCDQSNATQYAYNGSCLNSTSCPSELYANDTSLSCQACVSPCSTCSSFENCTSCVANTTLFEANTSCLSDCPDGYLSQTVNSSDVCTACTLPCLTCSGDLTFCLSCDQSSGALYVINGTCVNSTSCPDQTYSNDTLLSCQACVSPCSSCSSYENCTSCVTNTSLYQANSSCLSNCPDGFLSQTVNSSDICVACSSPCVTCSGQLTFCLTCDQSSGALYVTNGTCVNSTSCPDTTYSNDTSLSCQTCVSPCSSCSSYQNCTSCVTNTSLFQSNSTCLSTCPDGYLSQTVNSSDVCVICTSPCVICSGSLTFCLSCDQTNGSLYSSNGSCLNGSACPDGTYANDTSFSCQACVSPCSTCSSFENCSTCVSTYSLFESNLTCLSTCPDGYVSQIVNSSQVCTLCTSPCVTCSGSVVFCQSCLQNGTSLFVSNGSCLNSTSCPDTTYANDSSFVCQTCVSPCSTCSSFENCTSCVSNTSLFQSNSTCLSSCPDGYLSQTVNSSDLCVVCTSPCVSCSGDLTFCLSCDQSSGALYVTNGTCVNSTSCPDTTYSNDTSLSCQACVSPCSSCSSYQNCTSCVTNTSLFESNSSCLSTCPSGYLSQTVNSSDICVTCTYPCSTCQTSLTTCLSCDQSNSSLFLTNSSCVDSTGCTGNTYANSTTFICETCPSSCQTCDNETYCTTCAVTFIMHNGSCDSMCPDGKFVYNNSGTLQCGVCSGDCLTCSESATNCTSCDNTTYLLEGSCGNASSCVNGTYANSTNNLCDACLSQCSECSTLTTCTNCSSGFYLDGTSCVSACPGGTYADNSTVKCQLCTYPCQNCSSTASNCESCSQTNQTLYRLNNSCYTVDACPNTTYSDNSSLTCASCVTPCNNCNDASTCTTCEANFYLSGISCEATCPNYTVAINTSTTGECQACSFPCLSCVNDTTTCTECNQSLISLYLTDGSNCVEQNSCPTSTYPNSTTLTCAGCPSTCFNCTNSTLCLYCNANYYLSSGECIATCPNTTTAIDSSLSCDSCLSPCQNCNGTTSTCTSCFTGNYLYEANSSCLTNCPSDTTLNSGTNICDPCVAPCLSCANSTTTCTSCQTNNSYLAQLNACYSTCPDGYYSDSVDCLACTNNCTTCSNDTTCNSCTSPLILSATQCVSVCPVSTPYVVNNTCIACGDAISNCLDCGTATTPSCTTCQTPNILYQGACVTSCPDGTTHNTNTNECSSDPIDQKLTDSLTTNTPFPLPFTITGCIIFVACFMSKLQNKHTYITGMAYSLFGIIEILCLAYTLIKYKQHLSEDNNTADHWQLLLIALGIIGLLNLIGMLAQSCQLNSDEAFTKWMRARCNYALYVFITVMASLTSYKLKMIIFTRLFGFYCLKAMLDSVQKFRIFNMLSFLGISHEGLVLYVSALVLISLNSSDPLFMIFIDLVAVTLINVILALAASSKAEDFFEQLQDDGLKMNKIVNMFEQHSVEGVGIDKGKGLQSRDAIIQGSDDDQEFTLSISDRESQVEVAKEMQRPRSSIRNNKSALVEWQPSQSGKSIMKEVPEKNLAYDIGNVSAVYMGQLSPEKQREFQERNQISKELSKDKQKSERSLSQKQGSDIPLEEKPEAEDEPVKKQPQIENIFDNPDEGQDFEDIMMGDPVVVPTAVAGQVHEDELVELDQAKPEQLMFEDNIVLTKPNTRTILTPSQQTESVSQPNTQREIKVYKGTQRNQNGDEDVEEIDITIGKKQKELIELRKSIKRRERERERSQERKSRRGKSRQKNIEQLKSMYHRSEAGLPGRKADVSKLVERQTKPNVEEGGIEELVLVESTLQKSIPKDPVVSSGQKVEAAPPNQSKIKEQLVASPNPKTPAVNPKQPMQQSVKQEMPVPVATVTPLQQGKKEKIDEDIKKISQASLKKKQMPESESKVFESMNFLPDNKVTQPQPETSYHVEDLDESATDNPLKIKKPQIPITAPVITQNLPQVKEEKSGYQLSAQDISKIMMGQKSTKKPIREEQPIKQQITEMKLELKHHQPDETNTPLQNKVKQLDKHSYDPNRSFNQEEALDEMIEQSQRKKTKDNRSHLRRQGGGNSGGVVARQPTQQSGVIPTFPTEQSRVAQGGNQSFHEFNQSNYKDFSDRDYTERKFSRDKPPMHNRPVTAQKSRMYITGLQQLQGDSPTRTQQGFHPSHSKQLSSREGGLEMYPSSSTSHRVQPSSDTYGNDLPMKPRFDQSIPQRKEEDGSSLEQSFARRSMKSYRSRSIDREEVEEANRASREKNNDLDKYYKRHESPSNRSQKSQKSNRSRSRSKSREGKRNTELQKIYLQRINYK